MWYEHSSWSLTFRCELPNEPGFGGFGLNDKQKLVTGEKIKQTSRVASKIADLC